MSLKLLDQEAIVYLYIRIVYNKGISIIIFLFIKICETFYSVSRRISLTLLSAKLCTQAL